MYGNYGFNIPEPYEGTPCGSSVTIATRAKWGLNSIKTAVPMVFDLWSARHYPSCADWSSAAV